MKCMLITVNNVFKVQIEVEMCESKEKAQDKMKKALSEHISDEKSMAFLESGGELSNAILNENDAYVYSNLGKTYWHWKIIEIHA